MFNIKFHESANFANTFLNNREHVRFYESQIEALAIPVLLTSAKYFMNVLYLSNNHLQIMIGEPRSPRKQSAGTSQTSLMAAVIGQSSHGSYGIWMCVSGALHERTTTLHLLYYFRL